MLVLNDFWASTQDYNIEPQDVDLFMAIDDVWAHDAMRALAPELLVTAKTQRWAPEELLRTLVGLLDEWTPVIEGAELFVLKAAELSVQRSEG